MKTRNMILAACIFITVILQSTVLDYIKIYNTKPNLLIIFIIAFALLRGNVEGAVIGFFIGLSQDIVAGRMIGFYALLGLYLGFIIGSLNKRLYRENLLVVIFFTLVSTIAYETAVYLLYEWRVFFSGALIKNPADALFLVRNKILPEAVYNSVVSIFIFIFVLKLVERFEDTGKSLRNY